MDFVPHHLKCSHARMDSLRGLKDHISLFITSHIFFPSYPSILQTVLLCFEFLDVFLLLFQASTEFQAFPYSVKIN